MHTYATDSKDRESTPLWLSALAVATTLSLNSLLKVLNLQVPWWIDALSVMGFYATSFWPMSKASRSPGPSSPMSPPPSIPCGSMPFGSESRSFSSIQNRGALS
ncbi:hypothetical protein [Phormidium tenue]|uniref:Cap15 family CBASS effector n=1 Tax=Phormidium tenue TaxID=126344 RepID=UPI003BB054D7